MSAERFPTFEPMTAEQIETVRSMAGSVHHAGKVPLQLEQARRDLEKNTRLIVDLEQALPRLRSNRASLEQNIRTLEMIIAEADQ